jgi:uncharacterized protein involved in exopolysaccharide biosynthesis
MEPNANKTVLNAAVEAPAPNIDPMEIVRFITGAARRNPLTCLATALVVALLGTAIVTAIPRKYESTSKIYVSNTGLITSQLTSGRRSLGDDAALKDIHEVVFNHANLAALVHDAKLVENWPSTRNWLQRGVDRARLALHGATSAKDMEEMLTPMLETRIEVKVEDTASIRFRASWRDAPTAQKLTQLVQRNYIASKESDELTAIAGATNVLEEELRQADASFAPAVTELRDQIAKLREQAKSKTPQPTVAAGPALPVAVELPHPVSPPIDLTAKLNEIRNEERAILEPWQRRNADLKFQLADLLSVYGHAHPAVVQLENKLKAASAEPVELLDVRQREADLKASIANWAFTGRSSTGSGGSAFGTASGRPAADHDLLHDIVANVADDPRLAPARIQLESVLRKSQEMKGRLDATRMELAIAEVGFKYRYREIEPARFWAKPISPKYPALIGGVLAAVLILGFLAGAARELLAGKIMEEWQVKQLGVNVLARVDVRPWRGRDAADGS